MISPTTAESSGKAIGAPTRRLPELRVIVFKLETTLIRRPGSFDDRERDRRSRDQISSGDSRHSTVRHKEPDKLIRAIVDLNPNRHEVLVNESRRG